MTDEATRLRLAGFWRRLAGYLVDTLLLVVVAAVVYRVVGPLLYWPVQMIVHVAYWVGLVAAWGATPGMRAVGERVVKADTGADPTLGDAVMRFIGMILAGFTLNLGLLWVAVDARKQGLHDHIAKTLVVLDG